MAASLADPEPAGYSRDLGGPPAHLKENLCPPRTEATLFHLGAAWRPFARF